MFLFNNTEAITGAILSCPARLETSELSVFLLSKIQRLFIMKTSFIHLILLFYHTTPYFSTFFCFLRIIFIEK